MKTYKKIIIIVVAAIVVAAAFMAYNVYQMVSGSEELAGKKENIPGCK